MAWQNQAEIIKKKNNSIEDQKPQKSLTNQKKNHVFSFEVYTMWPNHKIMIYYAEQLIPII